jgi:thymidylate synthase (FAD)
MCLTVRLIARPQFLGLPPELGSPAPGQLEGPDAQKLIETAGRTCYDSFGKGRGSGEFAAHILESGHGSVLEHAQYTFFVSGISRGLTHELVRHRVGVAISQRSTRYVDESESQWVQHPLLEEYLAETKDTQVKAMWDDVKAAATNAYVTFADVLQQHLTKKGTDKLTARKQARGAARGILGNALMTELVWSANVRTLRHVIEMRASDAADAEIRVFAVEVLRIMRGELPAFFTDFEDASSSDGLGATVVARHHKV